MGYLDLLRIKQFSGLWVAGTISYTGDVIFSVAINWAIYTLTLSTFWVSLTILTTILPRVIVSPLAGGWIDKRNKAKTMIFILLIQGIISFFLAILYISKNFFPPLVLVILFALNSLGAIAFVTIETILPRILPPDNLGKGNSLFSTSVSGSQVLGFGIGGTLVAVLGPGIPIIYDSVTFFVSASLILILLGREKTALAEVSQKAYFSQLREGIWWLISDRTSMELLVVNLVLTGIGGPLDVLLVGYTYSLSGGEAYYYGITLSCLTLGSLVFALFIGRHNTRGISGILALANIPIISVGMIFLWVNSNILAVFAIVFLIGAGIPLSSVTTSALMQARPDKNIVGSVNGAFYSLQYLGPVSGLIIVGILSRTYSIRTILLYSGMLLAIFSIVFFSIFGSLKRVSY